MILCLLWWCGYYGRFVMMCLLWCVCYGGSVMVNISLSRENCLTERMCIHKGGKHEITPGLPPSPNP